MNVRFVAWGLLLAITLSALPGLAQVPAKRPNILVI